MNHAVELVETERVVAPQTAAGRLFFSGTAAGTENALIRVGRRVHVAPPSFEPT